jgi:hypothetical protein
VAHGRRHSYERDNRLSRNELENAHEPVVLVDEKVADFEHPAVRELGYTTGPLGTFVTAPWQRRHVRRALRRRRSGSTTGGCHRLSRGFDSRCHRENLLRLRS